MTPREQFTLPLPPPPADDRTPLVPARMVNEWVYCPRLAYLEWVEGEWADSVDTVQGRRAHSRVDEGGGRLPPPRNANRSSRAPARSRCRRSAWGRSRRWTSWTSATAQPCRSISRRASAPMWLTEPTSRSACQVCLQAMILEDNGYEVEQGVDLVHGLQGEGRDRSRRGASHADP